LKVAAGVAITYGCTANQRWSRPRKAKCERFVSLKETVGVYSHGAATQHHREAQRSGLSVQ